MCLLPIPWLIIINGFRSFDFKECSNKLVLVIEFIEPLYLPCSNPLGPIPIAIPLHGFYKTKIYEKVLVKQNENQGPSACLCICLRQFASDQRKVSKKRLERFLMSKVWMAKQLAKKGLSGN
jgi:hypothetical protein